MSLLQQRSFGPEVPSVASEAFSKAWNFIEHDPVLASCEREKLQAELARGILDLVQTGERSLIKVTNRAIRRVRERILAPKEPSSPRADGGEAAWAGDHRGRVQHRERDRDGVCVPGAAGRWRCLSRLGFVPAEPAPADSRTRAAT